MTYQLQEGYQERTRIPEYKPMQQFMSIKLFQGSERQAHLYEINGRVLNLLFPHFNVVRLGNERPSFLFAAALFLVVQTPKIWTCNGGTGLPISEAAQADNRKQKLKNINFTCLLL